MKKYKTLKEESDESWNRFMDNEKKGNWPYEKWEVGKLVKADVDDRIDINELCPTELCNLFHQSDMSNILINLRVKFTVNYWSLAGRDRRCQLTILTKKKHYLEVFATGYGTGESISFSKGFPDELKFKICRELVNDSLPGSDDFKTNILQEMTNKHARCMKDLFNISDLYHAINAKEFYDAYGKDKDTKDRAKRFKKRWKILIKTKHYKLYQSSKVKVKKDMKEREEFQKKMAKINVVTPRELLMKGKKK